MGEILVEIFSELIGKFVFKILIQGIGKSIVLLGAAIFSFCVLFQKSPMFYYKDPSHGQIVAMFLTGLTFIVMLGYRIYTFL